MTDAPHADSNSNADLLVHGLLVCRNAELSPEGNLTLTDILEVVALDELPGDAGPLTFVAFVRGAEPGPATCAFVVHPAGQPTPEVARLPLEVQVSEAMENRQVAVQVHLPSIPLKQGGWFDVTFEWEGTALAQNRFAIGARAAATESETS